MSKGPIALERYRTVVDVHLFLIQKGQILLSQRQNTGFEDGKFHVPAGHLEMGETVIDALIREAWEELGITIKPKHVTFIQLLHQKSIDGRLGVFFLVQEWEGKVRNMELEKCCTLRWFDLDKLPENMVSYARQAVQEYRAGNMFLVYGWE